MHIMDFFRGLAQFTMGLYTLDDKTILSDPSSGKALKDELAGLRSFGVGSFRIIYRVIRNVIEIVAIGPRERIYEETYRLLKRERR